MLLSTTAITKAIKKPWELVCMQKNTSAEFLNEALVINYSGRFKYDNSKMELKLDVCRTGKRFILKKRSMILGKPGDWKDLNISDADTLVLMSGFVLAGTDRYIDYRAPINRSYYAPTVTPHPVSAVVGCVIKTVTKRFRTMPSTETLMVSAPADAVVIEKGDPAACLGFQRLAGGEAPAEVENTMEHYSPQI